MGVAAKTREEGCSSLSQCSTTVAAILYPKLPPPGSHSNVAVDFDVLATYVDSDPDPGGVATVEGAGVPSGQIAAIVAGGCGLGRVVLCGVLVEASAELLVEQYGGVAEGAWPASWWHSWLLPRDRGSSYLVVLSDMIPILLAWRHSHSFAGETMMPNCQFHGFSPPESPHFFYIFLLLLIHRRFTSL